MTPGVLATQKGAKSVTGLAVSPRRVEADCRREVAAWEALGGGYSTYGDVFRAALVICSYALDA